MVQLRLQLPWCYCAFNCKQKHRMVLLRLQLQLLQALATASNSSGTPKTLATELLLVFLLLLATVLTSLLLVLGTALPQAYFYSKPRYHKPFSACNCATTSLFYLYFYLPYCAATSLLSACGCATIISKRKEIVISILYPHMRLLLKARIAPMEPISLSLSPSGCCLQGCTSLSAPQTAAGMAARGISRFFFCSYTNGL